MPNRINTNLLTLTGITEQYRFNYNGMEVDNEVSGNGNSYTTEFRQYDPRLGRWKSLDPLMVKYPNMSPYISFNNNPIFFIDPLGLEGGPSDADKKKGKWTSEGGTKYRYDKKNDVWYNPKLSVEVIVKNSRQEVKTNPRFDNGIHYPNKGADLKSGYASKGYIRQTVLAGSQGHYRNYRRIRVNKLLDQTTDQLFDAMYLLGDAFSTGESKNMVKDIIDHFRYGNGEDYENTTLNKAIDAHASTGRFKQKISEELEKEINEEGGFTDDIQLDGLDHNRPAYNEDEGMFDYGDHDNGLSIMVNDIHSYRVTVVDYLQVGNTYTATIQLVLYDHFGLDEDDISKYYQDVHSGFIAWWILQRRKGYKPFVTKMVLPTFQVSGTIR